MKSEDLHNWMGFAIGVAFLLLTFIFPCPESMSPKAWKCAGMGLLMATWWATEAVPIPVTSMMPMVLTPLLGLGSIKAAAAPYAAPTIYLFLGGFMLGLAMEKWNLHSRIALHILRVMGGKPAMQIGGFMLASGFLSMWVSNTATAIMMLPIGLSVIQMVTGGKEGPEEHRYACALLLGIAYAASLGGLATIIGTPPNALLVAFLAERYNITVGFGQWMLLGLPLSAGLMLVTWLWLTHGGFKLGEIDMETFLDSEIRKLGPMGRGETMVAMVFVIAALAWVFQPLIAKVIPAIDDTVIAMIAGLVLFMLPLDVKRNEFLLDWSVVTKIPWGILLLFGGGLSLAGTISSTGLAAWFADAMKALHVLPMVMIIFVVVLATMVLTEFTSNTATAASFLPLVGALAVAQGIAPYTFTIPAAIASSCAFLLPVSTPPNAVVFSSGHISISEMIRHGFALSLFSAVFVPLMCFLLVDIVWK